MVETFEDICRSAGAAVRGSDTCLQTHGGYGFACKYDIESKLDARLYQVTPILAYLAEHVLGLPRSY